MIGAQIGPYELTAELGAGGMGTVYLGESGDDKVAIKVVHPHLIATPGFFKRFLREAELGKQVKHENVVRTVDVDATMHDGAQINYMIMEYVEGRSLRGLLNDLGAVPEALLREVALQLAAGARAIHSEGVVHRDLKPENVLITDDNEVRIMDLGVAKLQEASVALTKEGQFAGSFLYAAPEQFQGGSVGPAADLYSLGVMLYELAVGDNPFRYDDAASVIQAQLHTDAPPARERNQEISAFFSELVATLLAKNAADRFESSDQLYQVLAEAEESAWWAEREKTLRERAQQLPEIDVRRATGLHGREKEMELLTAAWEEARSGRGTVFLVEGEPGIGKTRLVDAFMRSVEREQAHILYGAYPPSGGMGGIADAVIGKFGAANLLEVLAPYFEATPALLPAFVALIRHESAPAGAQPLAGDALHTVACNLVRALAVEKPTLWVIEDLHNAGSESHQIVLSMARALAKHRVLLVLTARPGIPDDELANLSRLERFQRLEVGRLSAREVIELLRDAFKSEMLAQKLGGTIAYKSDGVPFFVHELIRGLKEGRVLTQQPDGTYVQTEQISDIQVPSAVKDLIEGRLRGLSKEERGLLEVGAVQGFEFDPDLVARVVERKRIRVLQDLADIERRTGIVRASGRTYRFDQYQILEILVREISEVLREEYHGLLAEMYAEREGTDPQDDEGAYFLAWHHLHGSTPNAGLPYLQRALQYLTAAYRYDNAAELAERALASPGLRGGTERVEVLLRLTKLPGPAEGKIRRAQEAVELADAAADPALQARARLALAQQRSEAGRFEDAIEEQCEALARAREAKDVRLELDAAIQLSGGFMRMSRHEEGQEHLENGLALAREHGLGEQEAGLMGSQNFIYYNQGPPEDGLKNAESAIAILKELHKDVDFGNAGLFASLSGRHDLAIEYFKQKDRFTRETARRRDQAVNLNNWGRCLAHMGDLTRARETLSEALTLHREVGNRRSESYAQHRLAEVAEYLGESDEAERRYQAALELRREFRYERGIAETLAALGRLQRTLGRDDEARACLEKSLEIARRINRPDPAIVAAAHLALLPGGDAQAAVDAFDKYGDRAAHHDKMEARYLLWKATGDREHLQAAHELLLFGRDHAPEEYRKSILENVPLHRDIVRDMQ